MPAICKPHGILILALLACLTGCQMLSSLPIPGSRSSGLPPQHEDAYRE